MTPARRVRVARIITRLNVGGPAIQALLLSARLDPDRYETLLICGVPGEREGDIRELRGDRGVRPIVVRELRREIALLADARALIELMRVLRRFRPDVVHTHLAKAGLLGRVAARLVGAPVVVHTFHGNVLRGYFGEQQSWVFLQLERVLARFSTAIVAISERQATELRVLGIGRDRITEIPLGLELVPFLDPPRGALRRELDLTEAMPLVTLVARLVPIKGVDVFLEAAARVAAHLPEARFVIAGDGPQREHLESRAVALGLDQRLRFLGWRADLAAVYGDSDVVVLTSFNEGTPVSVIEALAAARAVVATDVGGVRDVLEGRGVLVPPGDAGAVASAILELLSDPMRRARLGAAGRMQVYPEYDAVSLLQRIDALYTRLLGGRTATHAGASLP